MSLLTRRGFTLIELMIALVLLGLVSAAVYKVLVNNQRVYLAQTQTIDLQQNIRAAAAILPAEFRELDAADGDIKGMGPDSLRIRAMRQLAFVCATPALGGGLGQIVLAVRTTPIYGNRQTFKQGDSILVYWEGNPTSRNDDQWLPAQLQKDPDPGFCADSNVATHPAYLLTLQPTWINNPTFDGLYDDADPLLSDYPEAQLIVRVSATEVFPNCPRYIHEYKLVKRSRFVPKTECETPVPTCFSLTLI